MEALKKIQLLRQLHLDLDTIRALQRGERELGEAMEEQLAALVMSSCGVSYKLAMSGTPVYNDVESIDSTYYGDLTRAQYFGFFPADENGNFNPKEEVTFGYALHIMEMVSNFAGK